MSKQATPSEPALIPDWMCKRLEEGLASPSAGEMTREKLNRLVDEGIARAKALLRRKALSS